MTEPLKPCPCGSKAELHEDIAMSGKGQFWVQSEAGWVGPTKCEPDDAVDAWNTRLDAYLASPGNTDPMTIAKYDDELRKASPSREAIALKLQEAFALKRNGGALPMLDALAMADAILSLSPASPAPVWRSMDSAPRDGTQFLSMQDDWGPFITWRDDTRNYPWRFLDRDNEFNGFRDGEHGPTAWTPLPAAPGSQPTEQPPQAEPTARDALQAIADIPPFNTIMYGAEAAYRAVEALFDTPPEIHVSEQPPQADVQVDKSTGEICTPPIRSTDANGDELVTFTSANTLADIARWIAENQTDAEEVIRILTDMTTVRALAGEEE